METEKFSIEELKKFINKKQLKALLKDPFCDDYPHLEEKKSLSEGVKSWEYQDKNELNELQIDLVFAVPNIKVKANYTHWIFNSGGDGYPARLYPHHNDHYFLINEDGLTQFDKNGKKEDEAHLLNFVSIIKPFTN